MKSVRSLACSLLCASFALLAGCGDLDAQGVIDQSAPVICAKQKECVGDLMFSLAYPDGVSACETYVQDSAEKKYGSDLNRRSTCTQAELDSCLDQFSAETCPADGSLPPVPCNC